MADPKPYKWSNRYYLIDRSDFIIEEIEKMGGQIEAWRFRCLSWTFGSEFDYWLPVKLAFNFVMGDCREVGWLELLVVTGESEENARLAFKEQFETDK